MLDCGCRRLVKDKLTAFRSVPNIQNLFGVGQIGGINPAHGPIEVQVREEDLEDAREALRDLLDPSVSGVAYEIPEVCPACESQTFGAQACPKCGLTFGGILSETSEEEASVPTPADDARRLARSSMVWAVLWLGGIGSLLAIRFSLKAIAVSKEQFPPVPVPKLAYFGLVTGIAGLALWVLHWYSVTEFFGN